MILHVHVQVASPQASFFPKVPIVVLGNLEILEILDNLDILR